MGTKFFLILKLLDHQKPSLSIVSSNLNIVDLMNNNDNIDNQLKDN
jgi:hypothetical protein